ncbi:hypothetical protein Csa_010960 [Cucumis sativus]|uniref:Uncharacterized protein n=1 Tax=Cucumis sativus TaxID=3659 RepID=A0A0A0L8B9_CUCSA|nr:hypothetical protein Csa_010960 [Cucumis sativus]
MKIKQDVHRDEAMNGRRKPQSHSYKGTAMDNVGGHVRGMGAMIFRWTVSGFEGFYQRDEGFLRDVHLTREAPP